MTPTDVQQRYERRANDRYKRTWANSVKQSTARFAEWLEELDLDPTEITINRYHLEDFISDVKRENDYTGGTLNNWAVGVRGFLSWASGRREYGWKVNTDENDRNSIYNADLHLDMTPRKADETGNEVHYIEKEDYQEILNSAPNTRDEVLLRMLWETGARPSETSAARDQDLGMKNDDHKMDDDCLKLRTKKQDKMETRYVWFSQTTKELLRRWIDGGKRRAYGPEGDYIINSKRAEQMHPDSINDRVKKIADLAGVQEEAYVRETKQLVNYDEDGDHEFKRVERTYNRINAKTFRHSYAVHRTRNGISLALLSDLLGHDSADITKEYYLKFSPDDKKEADKKYRP